MYYLLYYTTNLSIIFKRRQCVHNEFEEMIEDVRVLHDFVLQDHQVHQDVADGGHGVLGVHHLELGVVNNVERFGHICVILSLRLKCERGQIMILILERSTYLLIQPFLVTVKHCPVIGQVCV